MAAALNFNQRMSTIELMGAHVEQWGSGHSRNYRIAMHGVGQGAPALHYQLGLWTKGINISALTYVPVVVGPSSIEAIMALDMDSLQWLLE